jgi:hypothetical protein
MLGTIIYAVLDIGFNLIWFAGKLSLQSISYLFKYSFGYNQNEMSSSDLESIKNQMENKKTVLNELKLLHHYINTDSK